MEKPSARGYFDAFAPMHDEYAEAAGWPAKLDRLIGKAVGLKEPGTVKTALDLGAGTGISVDAVKRHAHPSRIVAVDTSSRMLDRLRERHGTGDVETVTADIGAYLAENGDTFDLITAMSALEFVPDLPVVLGQMACLLNDGGMFAGTYVPREPEGPVARINISPGIGQSLKEYYWPQEDIERSLTDSGLAIVARDAMPAYEEGDVRVGSYNFVVATKPPR